MSSPCGSHNFFYIDVELINISHHRSTKPMQVIVNGITAEQALGACQMNDSVPLRTLYSRVTATRERGTYNEHIRRADARRIGAIIGITEDDKETLGVVLPVTMDTSTLLSLISTASSEQTAAPQKKTDALQSKQGLPDLKPSKVRWTTMGGIRLHSMIPQIL